MLMEGAGVEVIDLGVDVPTEKFVEAVKTHHPEFVAMSALLTTTMMALKDTIEALEGEGLREIFVGWLHKIYIRRELPRSIVVH